MNGQGLVIVRGGSGWEKLVTRNGHWLLPRPACTLSFQLKHYSAPPLLAHCGQTGSTNASYFTGLRDNHLRNLLLAPTFGSGHSPENRGTGAKVTMGVWLLGHWE